jgi:hypothetical protein
MKKIAAFLIVGFLAIIGHDHPQPRPRPGEQRQ